MQHQEALESQRDDEVDAPLQHRKRLLGGHVRLRHQAVHRESHHALESGADGQDFGQIHMTTEGPIQVQQSKVAIKQLKRLGRARLPVRGYKRQTAQGEA